MLKEWGIFYPELPSIPIPSADHVRPPAYGVIDLETGFQTTLGTTGYNPVLEAEIIHKPGGEIANYQLVLTFQEPKDDALSLFDQTLPLGQIIFTSARAEINGEVNNLPVAVFRDALQNRFSQTIVYIGNQAYIHSFDLALGVISGLGFPVFRHGQFETTLNPHSWTKLEEDVVLSVSCNNSFLNLNLLRGSAEFIRNGRIKEQKLIIQQSKLPYDQEVWLELIGLLRKSPEDLTRLHQLLTENYQFRNVLRLATTQEEEEILGLL